MSPGILTVEVLFSLLPYLIVAWAILQLKPEVKK